MNNTTRKYRCVYSFSGDQIMGFHPLVKQFYDITEGLGKEVKQYESFVVHWLPFTTGKPLFTKAFGDWFI